MTTQKRKRHWQEYRQLPCPENKQYWTHVAPYTIVAYEPGDFWIQFKASYIHGHGTYPKFREEDLRIIRAPERLNPRRDPRMFIHEPALTAVITDPYWVDFLRPKIFKECIPNAA